MSNHLRSALRCVCGEWSPLRGGRRWWFL